MILRLISMSQNGMNVLAIEVLFFQIFGKLLLGNCIHSNLIPFSFKDMLLNGSCFLGEIVPWGKLVPLCNKNEYIYFHVHFLNDKWEPCHVTIGFFEITKNFGSDVALQVNEMLAKHGFNAWVITYVKDEGSNISTMTIVLTFVVSCEMLGMATPFVGLWWRHVITNMPQMIIFFNFFVPKAYVFESFRWALFLWTLWVFLLGLQIKRCYQLH